MPGHIHPYYAAIQRIVDASDGRWSISSLAIEAGMDNATIRKAVEAGSAPSVGTVQKLQSVLGLDYDGVLNWNGEPIGNGEKTNELREIAQLGGRMPSENRRLLLQMARKLALAQEREEGGGEEG